MQYNGFGFGMNMVSFTIEHNAMVHKISRNLCLVHVIFHYNNYYRDITPYPLSMYIGPYCSVTRDVLTITELCDA